MLWNTLATILSEDGRVEDGLVFYEEALRLDPNFARGQAQLANSLLFESMYFDESAPGQADALLRRAETTVHKALALDPDLSEAHGAYANLLRSAGRQGAEEQYKRALELNPNSASTWHDYAVFLSNLPNRNEESSRATERALELDPRQPVTWANHIGNLGHARDPRFRAEFDRAIRMVGDLPFAIDRFTLPALSTPGFPIEVMKAATIKQRSPNIDNLPLWINRFRAWLAVDPQRARQSLPDNANFVRNGGVDMESVRLLLDTDIAGILGDWASVDRNLERLRSRPAPNKARVASMAAFWHAVQGRYDEAAVELEQAVPIEESWIPPVMGGDALYGQMETAQLRILRATGRASEADRLVAELLARLRAERKEVGAGCVLHGRTYEMWIRHASLAANEGLKDEAVNALNGAQRCGDLPPGFLPQLPWFKALDGYPPYEKLKREREARIVRIGPELLRIETESGLATAPQPLQSPTGTG
jgi:tetratricopeptide (TPR) repeat protein